jgi:hypothetical protein
MLPLDNATPRRRYPSTTLPLDDATPQRRYPSTTLPEDYNATPRPRSLTTTLPLDVTDNHPDDFPPRRPRLMTALNPQQRTRAMSATRTGFDILVEKILGLNNENNSSLRTSLYANDKALKAAVRTAAHKNVI